MSARRIYYQRYFSRFVTEREADRIEELVRFLTSHPRQSCTAKRLENDLGITSKDLRDLAGRSIILRDREGRDTYYSAIDTGYTDGTDPLDAWPDDYRMVIALLRESGPMTSAQLRDEGPTILSAAIKLAGYDLVDYCQDKGTGIYSYKEAVQ